MQFVIDYLKDHLKFDHYYERSLTLSGNTYLFMGKKGGSKLLVAVAGRDGEKDGYSFFEGVEETYENYLVKVCGLTHANAEALRKTCAFTRPSTAGEGPSFGFGDRLGNATPGHIRAAEEFNVFPLFAQQSVREMSRTLRTPEQVMDEACWGVFQENYTRGFGADADHLKTAEDVKSASEAGFTMFTIDPSDHINTDADEMGKGEIEAAFEKLFTSQKQMDAMLDEYLKYSFDKLGITFSYLDIKKEAVKYLEAIRHVVNLYNLLASLKKGEKFDFEVSVDETETPTTDKSHIFIITQLTSAGVSVTGLAPRFTGEFQKGIDYRGDLAALTKEIKRHRLIAMKQGNYKISIHSGSDKFSVFPIIARNTHSNFHEKTAGTSYIEAIKITAKISPALYRKIHAFCLENFQKDRKSYHVTTDLKKIKSIDYTPDEALEDILASDDCRQLIHITYGSVLQAKNGEGKYLFRDAIMRILDSHEEEYYEALKQHFTRHLKGFELKTRK